MAYNPNAIWTSKKEPAASPYTAPALGATPPSSPTPPTDSAPVQRSGRSNFTRNAIIVVAFLCLVLGGVVAYYLLHVPPAPLVSLSFNAPNQIPIGSPATLSVDVMNSSTQAIDGATLTLSLPQNISVVGQPADQNTVTQTLNNLDPGASQDIDLQIIATGNAGSVAHIMGTVSYAANPNAKTQTTSKNEADVVVGDPVLDLSINAPQSGISGVPIVVTLSFANTSHATLSDVRIGLNAPPAFVVQSSSIPMTNGSWNVGSLAPGANGTIAVQGIVSASSSATFAFTGTAAVGFSSQVYTIGNQVANVAVTQPPLSLSIKANASTTYVSHAGDNITYVITYTNNASVSLQGSQIVATLSGSMFDFSRLATNGAFSSVNDTITWSPANIPALANLAPGASGNIQFSIPLKNTFPVHVAGDKNYSVNVAGSIVSPTVTPGVAATSTSFSTSFGTKVSGSATLDSSGYHYDAASGIKNAGPYPPVVDQPTQYTIHWTITNQATDINNVTVSAVLPAGIAFTGAVTSTVSSTPRYDPILGVVTWQIPFIPANAGVKTPAVQAIFQVEATPAVTDVGQSMVLLQAATLQATDAFTGAILQGNSQMVTTDIKNDKGVTDQDRLVRAQ